MSKIKECKLYKSLTKIGRRLRKVLKSMKLRIFLIVTVIGIVPTLVFQITIRNPIEQEMVNSKKDRLLSQCNILKNHIISENYMEFVESDSIDAELAHFLQCMMAE